MYIWSIGEGIICGAGLFKLAVMVAIVVTIGIFLLEVLPMTKKPYLLIINSSSIDIEDTLIPIVKQFASYMTVKSRNLKKSGIDMIIEVKTKQEKELLKAICNIDSIECASLLNNDGEVRI